MRRALLAIAGTAAGLVMLLSFKSHTAPGGGTATAGGPGPPPAGQGSSASPSPAGLNGAGSSGASGNGTVSPGTRVVTGNVANTAYGPVQVQLTLRQSKIIKVAILEQPTSTNEDIQIGNFAFPKLIRETLSVQSARIDMVSGASYTSKGYVQSLQSALDGGSA